MCMWLRACWTSLQTTLWRISNKNPIIIHHAVWLARLLQFAFSTLPKTQNAWINALQFVNCTCILQNCRQNIRAVIIALIIGIFYHPSHDDLSWHYYNTIKSLQTTIALTKHTSHNSTKTGKRAHDYKWCQPQEGVFTRIKCDCVTLHGQINFMKSKDQW